MTRMVQTGSSLADLASTMQTLPQVLINVEVADKATAAAAPSVRTAVDQAEAELGDTGRILLRPSGTEPMIRVMVEAPEKDVAQPGRYSSRRSGQRTALIASRNGWNPDATSGVGLGMRFDSEHDRPSLDRSTPCMHRIADQFGAAAELIDRACSDHLARLAFSGASAGRAHTARGDALRVELERLAAGLSQWSRASVEIAAALRASANRYADAELYAAARIA